MKKGIFRRYGKDQKGSTAVEFGLIAIGFITIVMGIIESGRLLLAWNTFQYAFENATRVALVDSDITTTEASAIVTNAMAILGVPPADVTVTVTFPSANGVNFVDIEGTYRHDVLVPFLPANWDTVELSAQSRLPRS